MGVSFLKRGVESQHAAEQQKQERELRGQTMGKMFRFWLEPGAEAPITFIDGELDEQGYIVPPRAWEHKIFGGKGRGATFYLCPEKNDPKSGVQCPICADNDYPSFNAYFTIIDHRPYKNRAGEMIPHARRLFVAPSAVMEKLVKIAQKTMGLAGQKFDVSRSENEKSARVGDVFFPLEKKPVSEWAKAFMEPVLDKQGKPTGQMQTAFRVADYEHEVVQLTAEELMTLGFGHGHSQSSYTHQQQPSAGQHKPAVGPGGHESTAAAAAPVEPEEERDIDDVLG